MNHTKLTPEQSAAIAAANAAMLTMSRERHAEHLARQVIDRENAKRASWTDLDAAKNLLARRFAAQNERRFSGQSITGFGQL